MAHLHARRLLISSGNGPAECQIAARHVLACMRKEAAKAGLTFTCEVTSSKHGLKSALVAVTGQDVERFVLDWIGVVQWVTKSPLRPHHKRQNWFVEVFELPEAGSAIQLRRADVRFDSFRAGGPGGQHQNTTDSAVRAHHIPTGITAVARDGRSQHRNKALAFERLHALLKARERGMLDARKNEESQKHNVLSRGGATRKFRGAGFNEVAKNTK